MMESLSAKLYEKSYKKGIIWEKLYEENYIRETI